MIITNTTKISIIENKMNNKQDSRLINISNRNMIAEWQQGLDKIHNNSTTDNIMIGIRIELTMDNQEDFIDLFDY